MPDPMHHKLTEAVPQPAEGGEAPTSGKPGPSGATAAEQQREMQESQEAQNAPGSLKDRLVDIGKANHMGGRSGGRVGDQG